MTEPSFDAAQRDYARGVAGFHALAAADGADVNPVCDARLLTHGMTTDRAVILLHGMTNCPQQFVPLGQWFFDQGDNVLIPRVPHNGLRYRDTTALALTTVAELTTFCHRIARLGAHLGRRVTVVGISVGATLAAYLGQFEPLIDLAVPIAPLFGIVPDLPLGNAAANWVAGGLCRHLPNLMTARFRHMSGGPSYGYPGFATRGLGAVLTLGERLFAAARHDAPAARRVLTIINDADRSVNNTLTMRLVQRWRARCRGPAASLPRAGGTHP